MPQKFDFTTLNLNKKNQLLLNSELIIIKLGAIIKSATKNNNPFLVLFFELLFWIKIQDTKNMVEIINEIPPIPKIKLELTRSNPKEIKTIVIV